MPRWFNAITLLLALGLTLAGCSRVGLAYRNLDVIVPWTLSDYLDMNRPQKDWFDQRLKEHLSWHCSTQLPAYLDWLDRVEAMVKTDQVSDQALQARAAEAKQAISQTARAITPSAVELLQRLSEQQVAEMNAAFAKDLRERQAKYVEPPLEQQIRERAERMAKRLATWLGPLSPGQRQRVQAWSASLGEQNREWIANRAQWQGEFSTAVAQRHAADFPQRIEQLLVEREQLWSPAYRQAFERTEQAARSLIVDLMAQSTEAQRSRLLKKLDGVRQDLTSLQCLQTVRPG